ncbi:broad-complex core protein-like, partial [Clarias magur]
AWDCQGSYVGLSITSIALLVSVCLNIVLYSLRRKDRQKKGDFGLPMYLDSFHSDSNYRFEEDERQNQDNPIYGNIFVDGGGTLTQTEHGDYEPMTKKGTRQDVQSTVQDEK